MKKDFTELTVAEFYHMEKERLKVYHVSGPYCLCTLCAVKRDFCLNTHAEVFFPLEKGLS